MLNQKRNYTIDIFRLLFSILVVSIHTDPFLDFNPWLHYIVCQIVARIAVPFFAAVSGFYIFKTKDLRQAILKYIKIYLIWETIYILIGFIKGECRGISLSQMILYIVSTYLLHPKGALWYLIGIILSIAILSIIRFLKIKSKIVLCFDILCGCIGCMSGSFGGLFPFLPKICENSNIFYDSLFLVFPFFITGYLLCEWVENRDTDIGIIAGGGVSL